MDPVDDFVTQQTPGLHIYQKVWGGMQCAYHVFAPGTDFTRLLAPMPDGLCGVPHHAYVISGTMSVIYKDGTEDVCTAGDVCYWPAPHNFMSEKARRSSSSAVVANWRRRPQSSRRSWPSWHSSSSRL